MADWKPGDLCQVRRGKRWVDAEVHDTAFGRPIRLTIDGKLRWLGYDQIRPRPAPRGKLPEPKAEEYRPTNAGRVAAIIAAAELEAMGEGSTGGRHEGVLALRSMADLRPVPKPKTARSKDYLAHVRTFPCCSCGATEAIHAHHVASGGMGQKASDYLTAPLCGVCHQRWHAKAMLTEHWETLEDGVGRLASKAVMWEAAARCLEAWVVKKGKP